MKTFKVKNEIDTRIIILLLAFVAAYMVLGYRLYDLQVNRKYENLLRKAKGIRRVKKEIIPQRGTIFDCKGDILAISKKVKSMYCVPGLVKNKEETARLLSKITGVDYDFLLKRMKRKSYFSWLKRKLEDNEYEYIKSLNLKGIGFREEYKRYYPEGETLCHIIGFVNIDNEGIEGLELSMDSLLKGEKGIVDCELDAMQREIQSYSRVIKKAVPGSNIYLSVDDVIQEIVDEELNKLVQKHNPIGACAIVLESSTGRILAMCSKPSYNPDFAGYYEPSCRRNRCISDMYEPGSVFKVITTSSAINENLINIDDVFFCENGAYRIGRHVLHDSHPHGDLTVKQIIAKSSNIGAAKIANLMDDNIFYKYIRNFGFGRKIGIRLPGEASGMVRNPNLWSKLSKPSLAMGHEILVTPLQMVSAVNVIANNGFYVSPFLVSKIEDYEGNSVYVKNSGEKRKILSLATANMMREALISVVSKEGTARRAALKRYVVAGKTGTAQKLNENGRYSHSRFVSSFAGFVPAVNPKITMIIVVNEPRKNGFYGGTVAAPFFASMADKIMKYLNLHENSSVYFASAENDNGKSM